MKAKLVLTVIVLMGTGFPCMAATITVTTTDTSIAQDGQCSLPEAIINANTDVATHADCPAGSGADVIALASSATYVLDQLHPNYHGPNGLPLVTSEITVEGNGSTIERSAGASQFRLIAVTPIGALELQDLTLQNGDAAGFLGGALYSRGTARLTRTTVTENTAESGGGIYSFGESSGLADLQVISSIITGNTAAVAGGIRSDGSGFMMADSSVSGNGAFSSSDFAFCGGVLVNGGEAEIHSSTISGNTAESMADLSGFGGGICLSDTTATISNSTISGNEARGANTTASMSGRGGGFMVVGGANGIPPTVDTLVVIEDSTICDNTAENVGGGVSAYRFVGSMAVEVELRNTIVAENLEQGAAVLGNCIAAAPAVISSADFNLADDVTCNFVGVDDLVVADVMLTPLGDHGGPTWTHAPENASPAVDSGDDALCQDVDQRGVPRPLDGDGDGTATCDRGAVESGVLMMDGFETGDISGWSSAVP